MRALVTGAGGFIGSHLVDLLLARGWEVRALVRYISNGSAGFLDALDDNLRANTEIIRGDLRDQDCLDRATRNVDTVFNLAALIAIPYSYEAAESYLQTNVIGTLNVLRSAQRAGVRRLIQTSTSEVYGSAQYEPMDESHRLHPQSPYAASKVASDQLALSFARSFDAPVVVLRPFNTYGPRQSLRAVIPTIVSQTLWSDRLRLGALEPVRDFLYVRDTCEAFLAVANADGVEGDTFSCATGTGISIGALVDLVGEIVGRDVPVAQTDERVRPTASEVTRLVGSGLALSERTGWKPTVDLREGLARVIEWIAAHPEHYDTAKYAK
jgi:NAD dependent epimerase/dehydratase